eukprot:TRINITY_DN11679_c0_g1_i1.p1 TRINITY_DN11679_c0_g1~~TRINITY_DN11679_c0_g1_i1.p1  ORF type:complete len:272 (+),score=83.76 TRINITY_DN11679_c0_g1_i1:66-881(+)
MAAGMLSAAAGWLRRAAWWAAGWLCGLPVLNRLVPAPPRRVGGAAAEGEGSSSAVESAGPGAAQPVVEEIDGMTVVHTPAPQGAPSRPSEAGPQQRVRLTAALEARWQAAAAGACDAAVAQYAHKKLTAAAWMQLCRTVVEAGGGSVVAPQAKVKEVSARLVDFLPCVPEHGSYYGDEDEDGVDRGGARRCGCLLPPAFTFDRTLGRSVPRASSFDPAPYLDDLRRDWDLVAYLSLPPSQRGAVGRALPSAAEEDWWAYAEMAAHGLSPAG